MKMWWEVKGHVEMDKLFRELALFVDSKEVLNELLETANQMQNDVVQSIDTVTKPKTGRLRSSPVAKKFKRQNKLMPAVFVAIDRKIAPHAHLVEFGHRMRGHTSKGFWGFGKVKGELIGQVGARPFFRPVIKKWRKKFGFVLGHKMRVSLAKRVRKEYKETKMYGNL